MDAVATAFDIVRNNEGDELDLDPADAGNWTGGKRGAGELKGSRFGVSAASYPEVDIGRLTVDDACALFQVDFWSKLQCGRLPGPIALLVVDAGWQHGVDRSARWLQEALGVPQDGVIGPITISTMAAKGNTWAALDAVCVELCSLRLLRMAETYLWQQDRKGFVRRVVRMAIAAPNFTQAA